jgi:hypothetical protein
MTQDRPTAAELLASVREFLDGEVRPVLDGRLAFHARVAVNALGIVERELRDGARLAAAERARASALLGVDGDARTLEKLLARSLRDGSVDHRRSDVVAHVRATVREKLEVANPAYVDDDAALDRADLP